MEEETSKNENILSSEKEIKIDFARRPQSEAKR
jgi:hypothetical protein